MARPLKEINWQLVEDKMEAGCTAREIAESCRVEINTFYDRFKLEFGRGFGDCADGYHCGGKGNVKYKQYLSAMKGHVPMLLHLGKYWLNQKDNIDDIATEAVKRIEEKFEALMKQLDGAQDSALKISETNINDETKS